MPGQRRPVQAAILGLQQAARGERQQARPVADDLAHQIVAHAADRAALPGVALLHDDHPAERDQHRVGTGGDQRPRGTHFRARLPVYAVILRTPHAGAVLAHVEGRAEDQPRRGFQRHQRQHPKRAGAGLPVCAAVLRPQQVLVIVAASPAAAVLAHDQLREVPGRPLDQPFPVARRPPAVQPFHAGGVKHPIRRTVQQAQRRRHRR